MGQLTSQHPKSKVLHFSAIQMVRKKLNNPIKTKHILKKLEWDLDCRPTIVLRSVKGNIVTKHAVNKVVFKEKGLSTLKPRKYGLMTQYKD